MEALKEGEKAIRRRSHEGRRQAQKEAAFFPQAVDEGIRKETDNNSRKSKYTGNEAQFKARRTEGRGIHSNGRHEHVEIDE